MKRGFHQRPSAFLLATILGASLHGGAHADQYDDLRTRWKTRTASPTLPPTDPDVILNQSSVASTNYYSTMNLAANRTYLWSDLPFGTKSANVTSTVSRLISVMSSYYNSSSPNYQVAAVRQAALDGFDWMLANVYVATGTGYDNWWDWQIGTPVQLYGFMMSYYNDLTASQLANGCASISHFMPDPTLRAAMNGTVPANAEVETGANRLDKALVAVVTGILAKDGTRLGSGRDAISAALAYVTSDDGYYTDGTFLQHHYVPYIGSYGTVLLNDIVKLYYILDGSAWPISSDPNYDKPFEWAMNHYRSFIVNGAMMDAQRGRQISQQFNPDHVAGRNTVLVLAELANVLPASQALELNQAIKGWVQRDTSFGSSYFTPNSTDANGGKRTISTYDIALVKQTLNDNTIPTDPEKEEARIFPIGDRALIRRADYTYGITMFSPRIGTFEYGNGENLKGWWTGAGMTQIYNQDLNQYANNFWATVDMLRLPGTTTDRSGSGTPIQWHNYVNTNDVVGGAELNQLFATVAMGFGMGSVTGSSLSGNKAWFLFGDRIIATGNSITGGNGNAVETIIENRQLNASGDNALTVNNVAKSTALAWNESMAATSWAHLAGNTASDADIGYVFPGQPVVNGLREQRNGNWNAVNTGGTTTTQTSNYLSLSFNHGASPVGASYSYIVLPNRSPAATDAFATANPVSVDENSNQATAVSDSTQGLYGVVFWADASKTVNVGGQPYLTSDKKAAVTIQQSGSSVQLAVADPTQTNSGSISLELNRNAGAALDCDPAVTVTQLSPTIKMTVAVNGAAGKSFKCQFSLNTTVTLYPVADAYVRDGTYAGNNFGSAIQLTVKQDATSYLRKSLLKFDLASINGTIGDAKLKLTATSVGAVPGMVHNLYQTATDNWAEAAVNWTSRPLTASLIGGFNVPAVNTAVLVDVTNAANSVLSGSKYLSLNVESSSAYGSNGSVDYGSKEHSNTNYRPSLTVTYF